MTGGLGLKREEAAAAANFSGSCSSKKQEARGRGLQTELRSQPGLPGREGEERGEVWKDDHSKPEDASEEFETRSGITHKQSARAEGENRPEFVIIHIRYYQGGGWDWGVKRDLSG